MIRRVESRAIWSELVASDSVGKTWGTGVRRAPNVPSWGFNKEVVAKMTTPYLMISGENDKQVNPATVRQLYADLGSTDKVFIDLACSSHNAMWEKKPSVAVVRLGVAGLADHRGKVGGMSQGQIKLGY